MNKRPKVREGVEADLWGRSFVEPRGGTVSDTVRNEEGRGVDVV